MKVVDYARKQLKEAYESIVFPILEGFNESFDECFEDDELSYDDKESLRKINSDVKEFVRKQFLGGVEK